MKKTFTYYFVALSACLLFSFTAKAETFIVNSENFGNYFGTDGYLLESVPKGSTLDFQGTFLGEQYSLYINKKVYVISSTGDAFFDSNTTEKKWLKFNVVAGADSTEITGLEFLNCDLFVIGASNVTIDNIKMVCNMSGVGSGTGFLAIHSGADSVIVRNSYFENGGTGSSCVTVGKGSKKDIFEKNEFMITGSSGNILSANMYVAGATGDTPDHLIFSENTIYSKVAGSAFMYGIAVCGEGNVVVSNTITMKGNAITNAYGSAGKNNLYLGNTVYDGGTVTTGEDCMLSANELYGALSVGARSEVMYNDIYADVVANGNKTSFEQNTINGTLTLKSDSNTVQNNVIITETGEYAVLMGAKVGNIVTDNTLIAAEKTGDAAANYTGADATANVIENNNSETAVNTVAAANDFVISNQGGTISITNVADNAVCNLYSASGAHLASAKASQGAVYFEVPAKGIYLVEVVANNNKVVTKIVAD